MIFITSNGGRNLKISVIMLTYNHSSYIREAIESVLRQELDAAFELVIGDDASTDNTREILAEYKSKFPNIIKLHLPENNQGYEGRMNFLKVLELCEGEYVALLEGDDFWTSVEKLENAVSFLDKNTSYSGCFHRMRYHYEKIDSDFDRRIFCPDWDKEKSLSINDVISGAPINTGALVFRKEGFKLPDFFINFKAADKCIQTIVAKNGDIFYTPQVLGCYRVHQAGATGRFVKTDLCLDNIQFFLKMSKFLDFKFYELYKLRIAKEVESLVNAFSLSKIRDWKILAKVVLISPGQMIKFLFKIVLKRVLVMKGYLYK